MTMHQPIPPTQESKRLVLEKPNRQWVFCYAPGEETTVLESLAETARNPEMDFNWFDAAVLSHQLGDHLHDQIQQLTGVPSSS